MTDANWKIDYNHLKSYSSDYHFALYRRVVERGWFGRERVRWLFIESYRSRQEARAGYEKIKELPEYLP